MKVATERVSRRVSRFLAMESLVEDWRHIEWRLSEAKHRGWSVAKPTEAG